MASERPRMILWRSKSTGRYCFKLCSRKGKPLVYSNQYKSKEGAVIGMKNTINAAVQLKAEGTLLFEDWC
jgi:hypothetical protein